jgi:hypothetical protein
MLEFKNWLEAVSYVFEVGDRVRLVDDFRKTGEVVGAVPGDGITPWYFIRFDDGTEDRYIADDLERE